VGRSLVLDEGPVKADLALVLAGDQYGRRILAGGDLVRQGYVPKVLVSGPCCHYDIPESELAIAHAVRRGYPAGWFEPVVNQGLSTRDEARAFYPELARRNVRRFLLVTSDYHTRRAARIFRSELGARHSGIEVRMVAVPDEHFRPETWWRSRESRKIVLLEWSKTLATMLGE
jgi:uncharacterized SAM-binding protein YcdF (DUF218 family)